MGILERVLNVFGFYSAKGWKELFERGEELGLFGESVSQPYSQVSNVYKAIKGIADNVPQVDIILRDWESNEIVGDEKLERLLDSPNPLMSGADFLQALAGFFALYGEVFIIKEIETVGQKVGKELPSALYVINPSKVVEIIEDKKLIGWRIGEEVFGLDEVIHLKDFNPYNEIRGLPPIQPARLHIEIDYNATLYNKKFFENDATPGLALSTDKTLREEIIDRIRRKWEARHRGVGKAFRVAILEAGLKPVQLSPTHKDMDFVEQRRFAREEVLGIWRVPKALFNITEDLNYATFMGQMRIFWIYTLAPILRKIREGLNRGLVYPYNNRIYLDFDYSNVPAFQEDFKEKVEVAEKLVKMGFTANEVNERLNLGFEEKPWRDYWWVPMNLIPSELNEAGSSNGGGNSGGKIYAGAGKDDDVKRKMFLKVHGNLERVLASKISRFFFEQRKRVLSGLLDGNEKMLVKDIWAVLRFDWEKEDEELKKLTEGVLLEAIERGVDFGRTVAGDLGVDEEVLGSAMRSYLIVRADKITMINSTVRRQLSESLREGIINGETIDELANRVRDIYNMAGNRAKMIARTETTGAVNGGAFLYYREGGIRKKRWITALDEAVRESHQALHGEIRMMEESFSNGLKFPGDDGPPEEVINCRCVLDYVS